MSCFVFLFFELNDVKKPGPCFFYMYKNHSQTETMTRYLILPRQRWDTVIAMTRLRQRVPMTLTERLHGHRKKSMR